MKQQINKEKALLYYAAKDFVRLNFQQKFNVGFRMGLCDHYDAVLSEEGLEDLIFEKVVKDKILDEFMAMVRRTKYDAESR